MPFTSAAGRIIHAAYYRFTDGSSRVVWFDANGRHDPAYHEYGECKREDGRPLIFTKPGETMLCGDKPFVVESIGNYPQ